MKACILAAGRGTRLGRLETPKGFLRLGSEPIVVESIGRLRPHVDEIVIVTGHLAEFYRALPDVTCVHNPDYAVTGSLASLRCAEPHLPGDFLLLESDLIYEPRALETVLAAGGNAVLLSGPTGAGDEVWVEAPGGHLARMAKDPTGMRVTGELVGISRLTASLYAAMRQGRDYEDALNACADRFAIGCPLVADLVWAEIDDAAHLERARREVYPRLSPGAA